MHIITNINNTKIAKQRMYKGINHLLRYYRIYQKRLLITFGQIIIKISMYFCQSKTIYSFYIKNLSFEQIKTMNQIRMKID